jgi:hypothetical protein
LHFNPQDFSDVVPGKEISVEIIGRVFDEYGDALLVNIKNSEKQYPHITLSIAEGIRRSYSDQMIQKAYEIIQ